MTGNAGAGWKRTGWYIEPRNARAVMSILGAIGVYSSGQAFAWRGMSSSDYPVISSLSRNLDIRAGEDGVRASEIAHLNEARSWGLGLGEVGYLDDLQLLSNLQHYGISTRLIDFTTNPMTALWFACQAPAPSTPPVAKSGVLLAMNVTRFRRFKTVASVSPTFATADNPASHQLIEALQDTAPFVVEAVNPNDRLRAQEGLFVAGVTPTAGLARHFSQFRSFNVSLDEGDAEQLKRRLEDDRGRGAPAAIPYVAVIIRADLKAKLLRYLEATYNRTARTLFPDYAGFLAYGHSPQKKFRT